MSKDFITDYAYEKGVKITIPVHNTKEKSHFFSVEAEFKTVDMELSALNFTAFYFHGDGVKKRLIAIQKIINWNILLKITFKYVNERDVVDENGPWDLGNARIDNSLEDVKRQVAMDTSLRLSLGLYIRYSTF